MGYIMDLRKYIGHKQIIMASADVIIINKDNHNHILLQKRKDNGINHSMLYSSTKDLKSVIKFYEKHGYKTWNAQIFR